MVSCNLTKCYKNVFYCSYRCRKSLPTRIIKPSTHWPFTCSKSTFWNPWKLFVKEFIFSKTLGLLPLALLKKLLHKYFSRSLIIDFRKPIFTDRLSVAASKIYKFLTSFMKSVLVWWNRYLLFYQNVFSAGISQNIGCMYKY